VKLGVIVPQGWTGEYDGWDPLPAWRRTVQVAQQAERLGVESIWLYDHFTTVPRPTDEITFESFTALSALAALTTRVRLGHIVICTSFRNPALTAKMISTMDTISGGRMELGIGAGWKKDEWEAYGYGFPDTRERLAIFEDHLQVIRAMLEGDKHRHATFEGAHAQVRGAINIPNVTWRLAARYADELNVDGMLPVDVDKALPVIRARCEEIGRDPATLPVSVHIWKHHATAPGQQRIDRLAAHREQGVARVMALIEASTTSDEALESFVADARAAGVELA
jgi:alkanesulfonate monooxygenase SsuD/methylene tetrahydromethanopterin reductase-like flavin-dependent oxidoreductase (luciferase family)